MLPEERGHSGDILTWLGYTLDDVRSLKGKGVIQ